MISKTFLVSQKTSRGVSNYYEALTVYADGPNSRVWCPDCYAKIPLTRNNGILGGKCPRCDAVVGEVIIS